MRQNQNQPNNKQRTRGRSRKGPSPLNRSFESNGPDVKIRGNAAHVAEKYTSLARDAQVSGDRVMAENYLQHAEHYSRIIATAQAQAQAQAEAQQAAQPQPVSDTVAEPGHVNGQSPAEKSIAIASEPNATVPEADNVDGDAAQERPRTPRPRRGRRAPRARSDSEAALTPKSDDSGTPAQASETETTDPVAG